MSLSWSNLNLLHQRLQRVNMNTAGLLVLLTLQHRVINPRQTEKVWDRINQTPGSIIDRISQAQSTQSSCGIDCLSRIWNKQKIQHNEATLHSPPPQNYMGQTKPGNTCVVTTQSRSAWSLKTPESGSVRPLKTSENGLA